MHFAPIVEEITFTAFDSGADEGLQTVANGDPIPVYGIVISNNDATNNDILNFEVRNGGTAIGIWSVNGKTATEIDIPWMADAGLSFLVTEAGTGTDLTAASVTVYRGNPGT